MTVGQEFEQLVARGLLAPSSKIGPLVDWWQRWRIPLTPSVFAGRLLLGLPHTVLSLRVEDMGRGALYFGLNGTQPDSGFMFLLAHRELTLHSSTAFHESLGVYDSPGQRYSAQGLGRQVLANGMGIYQDLDLARVELTAQYDTGGYSWARMGFLPVTTV